LCENILQRGILQGEVRIHPVEAAVLVFELLQPLAVGGLQPAVRGFPRIVRRGTDAVASPDLVNRATSVGLLEN
jgi:hypothetical protein